MDVLRKLTDKNCYINAFRASRFASLMSLEEAIPSIDSAIDAIKQHNFEFTPPKANFEKCRFKVRLLFKYEVKTHLVLKVMADVLNEYFLSICSPYIYSDIKNRSIHLAIKKFLHYQAKNDQLWIIQSDIANSSLSIPIDANSKLWKHIDEILSQENFTSELPYFKSLIQDALKIKYVSPDNKLIKNESGLPLGANLTDVLTNLYLSDIDKKISCSNLFYARYADEFLIASPDFNLIKEKEFELMCVIEELGLKINATKHRRYYYTKSGCPMASDFSFQGTNRISFLHYILYAHGKCQLDTHENKLFIKQCRMIIHKAMQNKTNLTRETLGMYICKQLKDNLLHIDEQDFDYHAKGNANCFLRINDYSFIKETDKKIALMVSEALTGIPGIKSFRYEDYQKIREQYKLPSLLQMVKTFHQKRHQQYI